MTVVVDASVWLLLAHPSDPRSPEARRLVGEIARVVGFAAPSMLAHEVVHIIHVKQRSATETLETRQARVRALLDLVTLHPSHSANQARLAEETGLSAYDAAYVDLAERLGSMLLTEDAKMHRAGAKVLGTKKSLRLADLAKLVD